LSAREPLGNTHGLYDNNDRLFDITNELVEYLIQFRTDDIIDTLTKFSFTLDIDETPILREMLEANKYEFRIKIHEAITDATLIINHEYGDPQVEMMALEFKNKLDVSIIFPIDTHINQLTASRYEGKIITFEAMISDWGTKDVIIYDAVYKCPDCSFSKILKYKGKSSLERCPDDKSFLEFFVPSKSEDMRRISLREIVNEYTKNKQPFKITADAYGRTAHSLELSNKVIVTGIFTSLPLGKENGRMKQRFIPTIQIISMQKRSDVLAMPDMDLIKKFKDLEDQDRLVDTVIDSFAYNVFEKRMEKKAAICAILGSEWIGGNNPPQIYVLFVGDPDTFKSTIMKYVAKVFDNCIIADATAVSGNGIKAVAVKMDDGTWSIRAGLLPTHHGGLVLFDEFGDLKSDIYAELKQCMIDGRIRKHVAGEDFDAVAETGIIASMNPVWDVWDDGKTLLENLETLGKALITRWDAIFRFSIKFCNEHEDEIDALFTETDINGKPKHLLTDEQLKLFFNMARTFHPKVTREALNRRNEYFKLIRSKSKDNTNFETRAKNSVMKFATALAKWRMCNEVRVEHVEEALLLYKESLETCNLHFEDGEFINESKLKKTVDGRIKAIEDAFAKFQDENGKAVTSDVKRAALESGVFMGIAQLNSTWSSMVGTGRITENNEIVSTLHPLRF